MFDFLDGLIGGMLNVGALIEQVFAYLWSVIVALAQFIWAALLAVANFLWGVLKAVGSFLHGIWEGFFKPILTKLANAIIKMHLWLEEKLAPVLRFLTNVRNWINRFFLRYIKPFLNTIQHIRRFLLILRLLHINFAAALDKKLAQIEGGIARVFIEIRGILNGLIDVMNALTSPPKLARLIAATMGGRRVFAGMTRLWTGLPLGHFFPNYAATALPWEKPVTRAADLTDPLRNPPASTLLSSISVSDFFTPAEGNPIPDDTAIDASSDTYIGGQVFKFLQAEDALLAGPLEDQLQVAQLIQTGTGNMLAMQVFGAELLKLMNPDLPLPAAT